MFVIPDWFSVATAPVCAWVFVALVGAVALAIPVAGAMHIERPGVFLPDRTNFPRVTLGEQRGTLSTQGKLVRASTDES